MELVHYWHIVRRRLGLIVLLVALAAVSYLIAGPRAGTSYTASMRFTVGLEPEPSDGTYYTYDRYYTWLTAEYLLDDLSEVVKSARFAQDVAEVSGLTVPAGAIQGATATGKLHRILTVSLSWPDAGELERIANATAQVLQDRNARYLAQLGTERAVVTLIDPPAVSAVGASLRQRLDLPLRLLLAALAGIALAFLLDYLDDTVRHRRDLAGLRLPILAEVPRPQRGLLGGWTRRRTP